ncbi:hypothetical protein [Nonomuraea sp. NPDC049309]|uniref:hypothetical protein n=1 Tax=Nonomuraea sp. NPDC049309 TaxID=3364350 RepID=UPI0037246BE6
MADRRGHRGDRRGPEVRGVRITAAGSGETRATDDFEISADGVDDVYCLRISPPHSSDPLGTSATGTPSVTLEALLLIGAAPPRLRSGRRVPPGGGS